jgi:DNA helicase-2/ATP-dependent DNA helicase PcrA
MDIAEFLAAKFPYIYLDEFQDTNPIQTRLVKWLAAYGSFVGVIGDPAQSIYAFQEARRQDFMEFELGGQANYVIEGNRRSTERIIHLLNSVRGGDVLQRCIRGDEGGQPQLLVGSVAEAIATAKAVMANPAGTEADNVELVILSRTNEGAGSIRNPDLAVGTRAWDELNAADSERYRFLYRAVTAGEFAAQGSFERASKELLKCFRTTPGGVRDPLKYAGSLLKVEKRGIVVGLLEMLITERTRLMSGSLHDFYLKLSETLSDLKPGLGLKPIQKGAIKEVAGKLSYRDLMCGVSLIEERRLIRTIHNAKGLEFTGVLVCLDERGLQHILNSNIDDEECRIVYVALSRATDHLFISVPSLSAEDEFRVESLGILTIRNDPPFD